MYNIFYAATIELMDYIFYAATIEFIEAQELGPIIPIPGTTPHGKIPCAGVSLAVLAETEWSTLGREASFLFCFTSLYASQQPFNGRSTTVQRPFNGRSTAVQ